MKLRIIRLGKSPIKEETISVFNKSHTRVEFILQFNLEEMKKLAEEAINDREDNNG